DRVPGLEGAEIPGEAPLHAVVDVDDVVGDFAHAIRGVGERGPGDLAGDFTRAVVGGHHLANALGGIGDAFDRAGRGELGLLLRAIFQRLEIEGDDAVARLLGEAAAGLVAPQFALD